jgi:hypothetical protein
MAKERIGKNLKRKLKLVAKYYIEAAKRNLKDDKTYASGKFADSIKYEFVGQSIDFTNIEYGKAVDEGSSPASAGYDKVSKAFISNIIEWAKFKGITPDNGGTLKNMAFGIAKTIKKDGIIQRFGNSGSQIFDRTYQELEERIGADITQGYADDIKNKLDNL